MYEQVLPAASIRIGISTATAFAMVTFACARGVDAPLDEPTGSAGLSGSTTSAMATSGPGAGGASGGAGNGVAGAGGISVSSGGAGSEVTGPSGVGGASVGGAGGSSGAGTTGSGAMGGASGGGGVAGAAGDTSAGGSGASGGMADAGEPRPTSIVFPAGSNPSGQRVASTGGSPFGQSCASDEVIVGYAGTVDAPGSPMTQLRSLRATCASLTISGDTTYVVKTIAQETLPQIGTMAGSVQLSEVCPSDQMVVGFRGRSGSDIDQIVLLCAPLAISGASPNFVLSIGPTSELPPLGGPGGNPFDPVACPAGQVAIGNEGRAAFTLNAFGLLCALPSLVLK
jgi:hypothetical protein